MIRPDLIERVRARMKRGLSVLGFLLALVVFAPSSGPTWWEVRLAVDIRGEYTVKDGGSSFSGEYVYGARWDGTMERDGSDFLLYHLRTEVEKWQVREKAVEPNAVHVVTDKDVPGKPALKMNYVLRENNELVFDFEVAGIPVPLGVSSAKFDLVLPCSRGNAGQEPGYREFIARGDNRVAVPDDKLDRRTGENPFSWEWNRQQWTVREKGTVFLSNRHKVEILVTLKAH